MCILFCKSDSGDFRMQISSDKEHSQEVAMNDKKSMRIFFLILGVLLAAGTVTVTAMRYWSQKSFVKGSYENQADDDASVRLSQSETAVQEEKEDAAASFAVQPQTQTEASAGSQTQDGGSNTVEYRFELKVKNGYLDVYHFHTDNLFFHTGVPYGAMTVKQRKELENGKYFVNEQELYGYLESCTS